MDRDIEYAIEKDLMTDEILLWSGRPNPSAIFNKADLFLVPFSVFWFGFAIFWTIMASAASWFAALFGIPFMLLGLYFTVGRFIMKSRKKRKTGYAITNKRIISLMLNNNGERKSFTSVDIRSIQGDALSVNKHNIGSITFGTLPAFVSLYLNTGMDLFMGSGQFNVQAFYDIDDADKVYDIYKTAKYNVS
jgi:hypothetical protein